MLKAALLHRKTYAFATSNRNYHFLPELSLQNQRFTLSVWFIIFLISALLFRGWKERGKPLPYTFNSPFQQKITKNISKLFVLLNKKQYLCKYGVQNDSKCTETTLRAIALWACAICWLMFCKQYWCEIYRLEISYHCKSVWCNV